MADEALVHDHWSVATCCANVIRGRMSHAHVHRQTLRRTVARSGDRARASGACSSLISDLGFIFEILTRGETPRSERKLQPSRSYMQQTSGFCAAETECLQAQAKGPLMTSPLCTHCSAKQPCAELKQQGPGASSTAVPPCFLFSPCLLGPGALRPRRGLACSAI